MGAPMTLSALIARVEEGMGPDREIDCLVAAETDIQIDGVSASWKALVAQFGIEWAVSVANDYHSIWRTELPRYTTSLDAVLSLIEQKLPGWEWRVIRLGNSCFGTVWPAGWHDNGCKGAEAETPARALLAATLLALSALEDSKADLADATNGDRP